MSTGKPWVAEERSSKAEQQSKGQQSLASHPWSQSLNSLEAPQGKPQAFSSLSQPQPSPCCDSDTRQGNRPWGMAAQILRPAPKKAGKVLLGSPRRWSCQVSAGMAGVMLALSPGRITWKQQLDGTGCSPCQKHLQLAARKPPKCLQLLLQTLTLLQLDTVQVQRVPQHVAAPRLVLLGEEQQVRVDKESHLEAAKDNL